MLAPKPRILYTEDDPDTRELVSFILTHFNCEVVATDTKEFAVTFARTGHFDLYLIDNWLRDSSGIELCQELRSFDSQTPILFYSGAAFDEDKERALRSGAQAYLTKPVNNDDLIREVFRLISAGKCKASAAEI